MHLIILLFASLSAGTATARQAGPAPAPSDAPPGVHAAYVVIGEGRDGEATAVARVIHDGADGCPRLVSEDVSLEMAPRSDTHGFDVRVCEATIPFDVALRVSWDGTPLPTVRRHPSRIVLLGDTGCKKKNCGDGPAEPFQTIAHMAASLEPPPELVLHAGDFNYRNTGWFEEGTDSVYDAGDDAPDDPRCQLDAPYVSQNADGSSRRDSWDAWRDDFFEPGRELLATAPLLAARGNHELCSRSGPGYFLFLDPATGDEQIECPPQGSASSPPDGALSHLVFTPPRVIDLGTIRIGVVDSANACDGFAPDELTEIYADQLASIFSEPSSTPLWLLTHRPFWAVGRDGSDEPLQPLAVTLQQALSLAAPELPSTFRLALGGHMHQFLAVTFPEQSHPAQLVVGNSGVATSLATPEGPFEATIDQTAARAFGSGTHGFMDLRRDGPHWTATLTGADGSALVRCTMGAAIECSPAAARRTTVKE